MNISFLFFLLFLFNPIQADKQIKREPAATAHVVNYAFGVFTQHTENLYKREEFELRKLKYVGEKAETFMQLAHPLGDLLTDSLNITEKKQSAEYMALETLSHRLKVKLDEFADQMDSQFAEIDKENELREFRDVVTNHLDVLLSELQPFLDPSKVKTEDSVKRLLGYCNGENGIESMAAYIKQHLVENCELNNTLVFLKMENLWLKIEQKFNVTKWGEYEQELKQEIHQIVYSQRSRQSLLDLDVIDEKINKYPTFEATVEKVTSMLGPRATNRTRCLTDTAINQNLCTRPSVSQFASLMRTEMNRLMLSAIGCAKFAYSNETELNEFLQTVGADMAETAEFLAQYIPQKMNILSSDTERIIANRIVRDSSMSNGVIPFSQYGDLAEKIRGKWDDVVRESYRNYLVIAPAANGNFTSHYICPSGLCSTVLDRWGVDAMLLHRPYFSYPPAEDVKSQIAEKLKGHHFLPLAKLVELLKLRTHAGTAIIVRHRTPTYIDCEYPTAARGGFYGPLVLQFGNLEEKEWFDDNTCLHMFLFGG